MYVLASENAGHAAQAVADPGIVDILLWGVLPYVALVILIGGTIWRYRTDQFGWTTRSSQVYESKLLRIASPLFHYGLAAVFLGHVGGLLVPKAIHRPGHFGGRLTPHCGAGWRFLLLAVAKPLFGMFCF